MTEATPLGRLSTAQKLWQRCVTVDPYRNPIRSRLARSRRKTHFPRTV
jgi:hypothetical protein